MNLVEGLLIARGWGIFECLIFFFSKGWPANLAPLPKSPRDQNCQQILTRDKIYTTTECKKCFFDQCICVISSVAIPHTQHTQASLKGLNVFENKYVWLWLSMLWHMTAKVRSIHRSRVRWDNSRNSTQKMRTIGICLLLTDQTNGLKNSKSWFLCTFLKKKRYSYTTLSLLTGKVISDDFFFNHCYFYIYYMSEQYYACWKLNCACSYFRYLCCHLNRSAGPIPNV